MNTYTEGDLVFFVHHAAHEHDLTRDRGGTYVRPTRCPVTGLEGHVIQPFQASSPVAKAARALLDEDVFRTDIEAKQRVLWLEIRKRTRALEKAQTDHDAAVQIWKKLFPLVPLDIPPERP